VFAKSLPTKVSSPGPPRASSTSRPTVSRSPAARSPLGFPSRSTVIGAERSE